MSQGGQKEVQWDAVLAPCSLHRGSITRQTVIHHCGPGQALLSWAGGLGVVSEMG